MECPACLGKNTMHHTLIVGEILCYECGHKMTERQYNREVENDYDRWLASPPDEEIANDLAR